MKHRVASLAGSLGCVALLVVACGGSSFEGAEGGAGTASGGESTAGVSGKTNGGSAGAGTTSGGASNGGTSSAGTSPGGTNSSGGASSGGTTSGGSTTGGSTGNPLACDRDSDCAACRYPNAPQTAVDCYCPSCGETPLSKSACTANQTAWEKQCSKTPIACPAIACVEPPVPQCKSHLCVVSK